MTLPVKAQICPSETASAHSSPADEVNDSSAEEAAVPDEAIAMNATLSSSTKDDHLRWVSSPARSDCGLKEELANLASAALLEVPCVQVCDSPDLCSQSGGIERRMVGNDTKKFSG